MKSVEHRQESVGWSEETWQSSPPHLLWGIWALPATPGLKVQLHRVYLRLLPTQLFLGMFLSYLFILSLYEVVGWWRTALLELLWGHTWNHRKVWMHSLLQSHTSFVHPCRTHPSQAESWPICGAFGTRWLNHLTELGTCMKILFWNPHNFVPVAWKWNFLQGFAAL